MDKLKSSFSTQTLITANCVKCGHPFSTTDAGQDVYNTKAEMIEALKDYDWEVIGDKAYCERCKK